MNAEYTYCPVCGAELESVSEEGYMRMRCRSCGFVHYHNPAPAVGVIIRDGETVLLVKRRFEPYRGMWVIPSGFVEYDEDARATAVREVLEETGLEVELDGLYSVESCFDDPRGNTLLVLYTGHVTGGDLSAGDDAVDVGYFPLAELPPVAFEAHRRVLGGLGRPA